MKSLIIGALFVSSIAGAHSRLKASVGVQPRSTNAGIKTGPCGVAKVAASPVLNAGDKLTVTWEETVQHTGHFEFRFSTDNDVTFSAPVVVPDTQDDGMVPHQYSTQLTLPSTTCTNCTLQLIQVMIDSHPQTPTYYYSCADFQLVNGGATAPTPPPATSPTPIPGLDGTCEH